MTPHDKQVMMFSATLGQEMRSVCKKFMSNVRTTGAVLGLLPMLMPRLPYASCCVMPQGAQPGLQQACFSSRFLCCSV